MFGKTSKELQTQANHRQPARNDYHQLFVSLLFIVGAIITRHSSLAVCSYSPMFGAMTEKH